MTASKEKTTRCPYPLAICDGSGKIINKNKPFDRVCGARISDNVGLVIKKAYVDRMRTLSSDGRCEFFPDSRTEGFCGYFNMPYGDGFAVVLLPEYMRTVLSKPSDEINRIIMTDIVEAECSEYKADAVMRIRTSALKALSLYFDAPPDGVLVSMFTEASVERLAACAAPLGVRITGKAAASDKVITKDLISTVAAELTLLFETAYYSSADGRLRFFSAEEFGRYFFGFSSECGSTPASPFILAEEYFIKKIASGHGHGFNVKTDGERVTRLVSIETGHTDTLKNRSDGGEIASIVSALIDF